MADYTQTTWVDEVTKVGPTNLNKLEAGVKDAAEHQNAGLHSARPPADAAHKHHIWRETDTGAAYYCDGANWIPLGLTARPPEVTSPGAIATPTGSPPPDENIPAFPSYVAQRITTATAGLVTVIRLRLGRTAALTGGEVQVALYDNFADPVFGDRPGNIIGYYGGQAATKIASGVTEYTFLYRNASGGFSMPDEPQGVPVAAGAKVHVVVMAVGITGGSAQVDARSGLGGVTYDSAGSTYLAGPSFGGVTLYDSQSVVVKGAGGYGDIFRVEDSTGTRLLVVDRVGLTSIVPEGWNVVGAAGQPAFQNSWVNYGISTWATAAFFKDPGGVVHVRGLVNAGTLGTTVFQLPVGYRPAMQEMFIGWSHLGAQRIDIQPTGALVVNGSGAFPSGGSSYVSLSGISLKADQ